MSRSPIQATAIAACLLVLLLAGCQRTMLAQPPAAASGCDPRLQGHWRSIDGRGAQTGEIEVRLGADCMLWVVEHGREAPRAWPPIALASARIGRRDLLWFDATIANAGFEVATGPVDREGSVYVFAYRIKDEQVTLLRPDHRRLARLVVEERIEGGVLADGSDLAVRLDGEPAELAALLARRASFTRADAMRFRRAATDAGD